MGNCQAVDAATLIIQHPDGKVDRMYWAVNASEIMKTNPGHYVALLISTQICNSQLGPEKPNSVRLTRIKLLKPTDSLVLGQVYRLITAQEVLQGLKAKKDAKMKKYQSGSEEEENSQAMKQERSRRVRKSTATASIASKSRTWQPSLQSISEAGS